MSTQYDWSAESERREAELSKRRREHRELAWGLVGLGLASICIIAFAEPKNPTLFQVGATFGLVIGLAIQRWFWIVVSLVMTVTLTVTALACIVHFMILEAVAATFGAFIAFGIFGYITDGRR